jgi:transposase
VRSFRCRCQTGGLHSCRCWGRRRSQFSTPAPASSSSRRSPTKATPDCLAWLAWLTTRIDQLDDHIAAVRAPIPASSSCSRIPGVGPLTALTTVLVLGPLARFPDRKHVVRYVGLAPAVHASADKPRLGKITKQGNALLRWVLGQAAPLAARADDELRRRYFSVMQRRGRPKAKVALARKRLVRLYIM